jgi:hypothetical protein
MKKTLISLFTFFTLSSFGQVSNNSVIDEHNVYVNMELSPIIQILVSSKDYVNVTNTETVLLNFCDKIVKIRPGFHRIRVNIDQDCEMILIEYRDMNLESQATSVRVIKDGMEDINYLTGQIVRYDYLEYTVCNFYLR